jgi:hypothetical protein
MGIYPVGTRVMGTHCHPYHARTAASRAKGGGTVEASDVLAR